MLYWNLQQAFYTSAESGTNQRQTRYYTEDLLHNNIGKELTIHLTYEENPRWNAKVLTGTL